MDPEGFSVTVQPILTARGLVKKYGRVTALDHADFDLYPGEILAVIGDNGAGKSSMIKALCGAVIPDSGEMRLAGEIINFRSPIDAREAGIETVYQTLALSPALSIADNMFLGREMRSKSVIGSLFRSLDRRADRIHIHRLGRRLTVIDPKQYSMSDAVAFMTGAKAPPEAA
jgi:fructose transport system ATP-binding protein